MLVTQSSRVKPQQIITGDWELIGEIDVPSQTSQNNPVKLGLGVYEKSQPQPTFVLEINPDPSVSSAKDALVPTLQCLEDDSYTFFYLFNNVGGPLYHVRVWQSW